jgi:hypothetical protein
MKIKTILVILLLMSFSLIFASENPTETEHWEKVRQLDQLAERFKVETGFRGSIETSTERMCLGYYEGKFADIQITADADTTSFRAAFERILDKILPYTYAKREQLSRSKITNNLGRIKTEYFQQVNGYRVEVAGKLSIVYETGRNGFAIGNSTVQLPGSIEDSIISEKEAQQIALREMKDDRYQTARVLRTKYSNVSSDSYYLAHVICVSNKEIPLFGDYIIWLDAVTGKVMRKSKDRMMPSDIDVTVKGNIYPTSNYWSQPPTNGTEAPIVDVQVSVSDSTRQTNYNGNAAFNGLEDQGKKVTLANSCFHVSTVTNLADTVSIDITDSNSTHIYSVSFPDINGDHQYFLPNACSESLAHMTNLSKYRDKYYLVLPNLRIAACPTDVDLSGILGDVWGGYSPNTVTVTLRDSRLNDVIRHELSHHFINCMLGADAKGFDPDTLPVNCAMDEAGATYFGGAPTSTFIVPNYNTYFNLNNLHTIPSSSTLTEESYSLKLSYIPLASAWWSLRGNRYFPPDTQGINGVDTLLVNSLEKVGENISQNNSYRYKPRYFYNILMSRVDTDGISWPLNDKQLAINEAYNDRGFHFYPTVQSVAHSNNASAPIKETYNVLDSVYVRIENCPQNTYVKVLIVPHQIFNNVGSSGMTIPSACEVNGNPVSKLVKTSITGTWAGDIPFSNQLPPGDYDIIVDVGSPTAPDNRLNLVFDKDNIIDAVDGLEVPGFTKTGWGDAVVALDLSSSMNVYGVQQAASVDSITPRNKEK